jgi:hypothetical protein
VLLASELVRQLKLDIERFGDNPIVVQGDSEGNSYDYARGTDFCFITEDLQTTYDTLLEVDVNEESQQVHKVFIIYP